MRSNPESNPGLARVHHELRTAGIKDLSRNPLRAGVHQRGYLPHVKREGASYFVTFRLADSLPKNVLLEFEQKRAEETRSGKDPEEVNRDFRRKLERYLDGGVGECHLKKPELADLVAQAIRYFENERYLLGEWCVMPNHVHVVLQPLPNFLLSDILKSWKGFTAREANRLLARTGKLFWQPETYDHWIRNEEEKARISHYVRNNPVKAGLCATPEGWRWGSAWENKVASITQDGLQAGKPAIQQTGMSAARANEARH
jgi:REP element-mobilizing transposase RayT